nr:Chain E, ATP-Peptide Conjugate [synthetic construct]2G1T_F Chain F, ATP-Peptide Conjugate [synthetic construct]2G1T_G Chain G, ATP-Peptide Conjugate [synthetic construct]2G1T_H Chain H, ATP-Peptide Conjugate [synthetic construct]2G2I_C Chain C, ATP-Peptide Conjugate [synthetic construct]2G2I_D Chain D, ATP-Peptide Conjugate [synthetic construct]
AEEEIFGEFEAKK